MMAALTFLSPDGGHRLMLIYRTVVAMVALGLSQPAIAQWLSREEAIMGTAVRAEVWSEDRAAGEAAITAVMDEMRRIDATMSPYKPDSDLSRINQRAAREPVRISREMFDLIARSLEVSKLTEGAFDITFSSVGYLYDYRKGVAPSDGEIAKALPGINYRHVLLDAKASTIRFARGGVRIDLGGIAKGHAVDRSIDILRRRGIANALVSAGGDTRVLGDHRGRPWMVAVRDPRRRDGMVAVLPLADTAISTSGDYERYFEVDGKRYHHILNPKTGKSTTGVRSVSIIAPDATTTDGLSTSVFVMGRERGMVLVERLKNVDAIIVDDGGKMHYSSRLQQAAPTVPPRVIKPHN